MHDKLEDGKNLRLFKVIDDLNSEALGIEEVKDFAKQWMWPYNQFRIYILWRFTPKQRLDLAAWQPYFWGH